MKYEKSNTQKELLVELFLDNKVRECLSCYFEEYGIEGVKYFANAISKTASEIEARYNEESIV